MNGMGVLKTKRFIGENGVIDDVYRIEYFMKHLRWLYKAIEEREHCILDHALGPHLIAGIGIKHMNRYGFISVDI